MFFLATVENGHNQVCRWSKRKYPTHMRAKRTGSQSARGSWQTDPVGFWHFLISYLKRRWKLKTEADNTKKLLFIEKISLTVWKGTLPSYTDVFLCCSSSPSFVCTCYSLSEANMTKHKHLWLDVSHSRCYSQISKDECHQRTKYVFTRVKCDRMVVSTTVFSSVGAWFTSTALHFCSLTKH